MKDMKTKKIVLAVCMVALMLAVAVVPAIQGPTDADATVTHNFSDSYMYVITLDGTSTEKINDVQVSVNGSALTSQKSYDGTNKGVSYIKDFWKFDSDTGLGPFNSFYAAVNLTSGTAKIGDEDKIASDAGQIAFVLDPNNLKKTRGGTNLTSCLDQFNIMLIIPTVYWKASDDGTKLYISNSASYTASGESTVTDMVAYAHIANPLDDGGRTHTTDGKTPYPYIGIGVYEASVADGKLYSKSGKYPAAWASNDTFVGYAQAQTAASAATGSAYQQWNFYQWTLYKIMSYSVMGTKNSQQMIGNGYTDIGGPRPPGFRCIRRILQYISETQNGQAVHRELLGVQRRTRRGYMLQRRSALHGQHPGGSDLRDQQQPLRQPDHQRRDLAIIEWVDHRDQQGIRHVGPADGKNFL